MSKYIELQIFIEERLIVLMQQSEEYIQNKDIILKRRRNRINKLKEKRPVFI